MSVKSCEFIMLADLREAVEDLKKSVDNLSPLVATLRKGFAIFGTYDYSDMISKQHPRYWRHVHGT